MNGVFIVPTGIGAEIGGHSGDATPAAKLIASVSDILFIHPNVVNASDINDMTENMLYVEGSILDRFLDGTIGLKEVHSNKILVVVNAPVTSATVNAVSGARATIGANIEIVELITPLRMVATQVDGKASGDIYNLERISGQLQNYNFDVLVVNTPIETDDEQVLDYLTKEGGVNLWGGVEAKLSKELSFILNKPVIHAPIENSPVFKTFKQVVDPRKAAEMVSICNLHCCLKGAHRAPKISTQHSAHWVADIDFLVSPWMTWGPPHDACKHHQIPIIFVRENKTILSDEMPGGIIVNNYLEAAGVIVAKRAGVSLESVRRPLPRTNVHF